MYTQDSKSGIYEYLMPYESISILKWTFFPHFQTFFHYSTLADDHFMSHTSLYSSYWVRVLL